MFGLSPAQGSCQGNNDEGSSWIVQLNMFCNIESGMRLCNINESEALNSSHQHESIILSYQSSAPGIFALQDDWVCWATHCTLINTWNKELSEFLRKNFDCSKIKEWVEALFLSSQIWMPNGKHMPLMIRLRFLILYLSIIIIYNVSVGFCKVSQDETK